MNDKNTTTNLKTITPMTLYNMTQDGLHLVILDFRSLAKYLGNFIRRSYHLDINDDSLEVTHDLFTYIEKMAANLNESIKKYNTPKDKRLVVITESSEVKPKEIEEFLQRANLLDQFDRKYIFVDNFENFKQKYPFLILSLPESACAFGIEERQKYLIENCQEQLVYSNSQFPLEIVEGKIFMGNNFNKNSNKQRTDLGINYSVEVKKSSEEPNTVTYDIDKKDLTVSFDTEKMIDFDTLIDEINAKTEGKAILICGTNIDITAGFLIAILMKNLKIEINAASLRVFSKIGNTTVDRTLYNHLIHYTPNKIIFKKI